VFSVTLPAARAQAATVETPTESAVTKSMRRGRVLVVDDDPILGQACRNVLSDEHDVTVLTSGADALERISGGESFDVILCDLMMPQITGMEFHAALARLVPSQAKRIVFMTGGAFTQASRDFLGGISNEWVEKPFSMQRLREVVRSVVE
jgi:CheY-like chemotaxis protein